MSRIAAFPTVFLAFVLGACGQEHGEKGNDLPASVITHFTDRTELFVEFEPLRAGEPSIFAAHVTRLSDFKPIASGKVAVVLSGAGLAQERFETDAPASPGIFKPLARPRAAGVRKLSIELDADGWRDVHDLGEVTVFADAKAALEAAKNKPREEGGIAFLKEQQWQVDFATELARGHPLRATVPATGLIRASGQGSAQVSAPVSGVLNNAGQALPHTGMRVRRGDILFYIVPKLAADVDMATLRRDAEKARLHLEHTQRERARLDLLFREEAVAERRVLDARHEEELARAEAAAAQKRLQPYDGGARTGLGVPVRAPVDATVVEVNVAAGAAVAESQALIQLADPTMLWLEARIAEADVARVRDVQGAWIRAAGLDRPMAVEVGRSARLVAFGQAVDPASRTAPLILEFSNPDSGLRIGTAVRAEIWVGAAGERLAVPASALVEEGGQQVVFVQRGGELFERRVVTSGIRDGAVVELRSGLRPGERVVTRGAYLVRLAGSSPKAAGEGHVH